MAGTRIGAFLGPRTIGTACGRRGGGGEWRGVAPGWIEPGLRCGQVSGRSELWAGAGNKRYLHQIMGKVSCYSINLCSNDCNRENRALETLRVAQAEITDQLPDWGLLGDLAA